MSKPAATKRKPKPHAGRWPPGYVPRTRQLLVKLTDDELTLLRHLAERDGVTVSEWVRRALRLATAPMARP